MSILGSLFGAGGVGDIVKAVGGAADSLFTSDEERGKLALEERKLALEEAKLADRAAERQVEVNLAEAAHPSMLVAGWRPAVGWVCVVAMLYHFLIQPLAGTFIEASFGIVLIDLDWQELSIVLLGMLGLGAQRSYDKLRKTDTRRLGK